ncbi:MAG: hypothetical protein KIG43_00190 [Eubacteriales bacterium]|nr:hypothetical protein [Eubacteriales bacterium]
MKSNYDDIINLPHHVSSTRPQMSMLDRAAQFSPFAALTGYDAAIEETGRLTDEKIELDEDTKAALDMKQAYLIEMIDEQPEITIIYFLPDARKAGGAYVTVTGNLKRFDEYERLLILTNGKKIPMDDIADIESDLFKGLLGGDVI